MFEHDEIPNKPIFKDGELDYLEYNRMVNNMQFSQNTFCFYENEKGRPNVRFVELNEELYASMVYYLSQKQNENVRHFLKLVLEGTGKVLKRRKKDWEMACKLERLVSVVVNTKK
jgi:C-terminal processing protease CtpA/Prc